MFEDIDPEQAKFLEDLDQWDQESQEILLDLAHNNQFITFEEMDKGIYGKGADPFEKIRTNKSFREISNEIAMSSPFGKESMMYRELREIITGQIPKI